METAMTLMTGATLGCNNDWLNTSGGNYNGPVSSITFTPTIGYGYGCYPLPFQNYYYYTMPSEARPIKLTLSEVERLRKVAKADQKIKDILQKFTSQIEITVDFE